MYAYPRLARSNIFNALMQDVPTQRILLRTGGLSAGERCCQESLRPSVLFLFVVMAAEPASLMYATTNPLGFVWRPLTGEEEQVNRVRLS